MLIKRSNHRFFTIVFKQICIRFSNYILKIDCSIILRAHTDRSVRRATNRQAIGRTNSSQLYTIRSATSYIIVTCSSVFVTASVSQRFIAYCNNMNFRTFAKNDFEKNLYKLMNAVFDKPWRTCTITSTCNLRNGKADGKVRKH